MPSRPRVVIHGHFYQPPREDPWLNEMPRQIGAAPWHDWNEKIERECYRAVVAARVVDADGKIVRIMNTLSRMSYDVGPTLFEWMEQASPATYAAILEADRISIARTGHGNAIAQPYHHVILPLASRRDKVTEVRWGIADFARRFGRAPEGMWLPETAVDDETLDVLAQEGIAFTILGPAQVKSVPPKGAMGKYTTESGREIAIGIYDGDLSHGVAFGRLLTDGRLWKTELLKGVVADERPPVIGIATDGETYGHHHHFSEMALAWLFHDLERTYEADPTNYGAVLAETPPEHAVDIVAPSSWSCVHGVERWRSNCGCRMDQARPPQQGWRGPLRSALDLLRTHLDARFTQEGEQYFVEPWAARDAYGAVVGAGDAERDALVLTQLRPELTETQIVRARELLEMARDSLRMYTSCAWFFDDLTGLEVPQNLRYAARAIDLAGESSTDIERAFVLGLEAATSGEPGAPTAADVWATQVRPTIRPVVRLAAGVAAANEYVPDWVIEPSEAFHSTLAGRRVKLTDRRTGRARDFDVAVKMHLIDDVHAYVWERGEQVNGAAESATPAVVAPTQVMLSDFPERERNAVRDAVRIPRRHELVRRVLGETALACVVDGDLTLLDATFAALGDEVRAIADDPTAARAARALEALDLLDLLGRSVSFDVQTAFARVAPAVPPSERDAFVPLAERLGFSREVFAVHHDTAPITNGVAT